MILPCLIPRVSGLSVGTPHWGPFSQGWPALPIRTLSFPGHIVCYYAHLLSHCTVFSVVLAHSWHTMLPITSIYTLPTLTDKKESRHIASFCSSCSVWIFAWPVNLEFLLLRSLSTDFLDYKFYHFGQGTEKYSDLSFSYLYNEGFVQMISRHAPRLNPRISWYPFLTR